MNQEFKIETTEKIHVLSIKAVTSVSNLPAELGKAYGSIMSYLGELGEQPTDGAFTAYYNMDMDNLQVEMGFTVARELPGRGEIKSGEIPQGKKAVCMYKGPYSGMAPTYGAMTQWISENGYEPQGTVYEFYYNSPMEVPESELLTKIMFVLK